MNQDNGQNAYRAFPGLSDASVRKFQQQVESAMDKAYKSYHFIGYDLAAPFLPYRLTVKQPPPVPTVTKCSGCDQERDLGATGKCWDCYVDDDRHTATRQCIRDAAEAAKVEQIKRTTMLAASVDPLWQRNPNVGVWRLR